MGTLQLEKRNGHNDIWRREKGQNAVVVRRAKEQDDWPPLQ